jgi:hypothetical protein
VQKGSHHNNEAKQKIKEARAKQVISPEVCRKRGLARRGIPSKLKGRHLSLAHKMKTSRTLSERSKWKGWSYGTIHKVIRRAKPKVTNCEKCGRARKRLELSFKNPNAGRKTPELYTLNVEDYEWLCVGCHNEKDGKGVRNEKGQFM